MTIQDLIDRQIRDCEQLVGKTVRLTDEYDGRAILVFTDGTFVIIDGNPEGGGCGFCCDAWWTRRPEVVAWVAPLLV